MFRLGGNVRQNYSTGTTFSDIEKLINERTALREKAIGGIRTALPLQVLANQPIESIRNIGDVVNILSGLPKDPGFLGALTKLPSLDLKMKEGELSDKISLAKLKQSRDKKFEFEKRIEVARGIEQTQKNLLAGKSEEEQKAIRASDTYKNLEKQKSSILREMSETDYLFQRSIKDGQLFDIDQARKDFQKIKRQLAEGARVGFQEGTPNPTLPQPKPKEPMDDRKVENLMRAAPALENPGEVKEMAMKD